MPRTKLARLERHFDHVTNVHVVLSVERERHRAEATVHVTGRELFADAIEGEMYAAIDALADKLDRQIKRYKEKTTDHHRESGGLKANPPRGAVGVDGSPAAPRGYGKRSSRSRASFASEESGAASTSARNSSAASSERPSSCRMNPILSLAPGIRGLSGWLATSNRNSSRAGSNLRRA